MGIVRNTGGVTGGQGGTLGGDTGAEEGLWEINEGKEKHLEWTLSKDTRGQEGSFGGILDRGQGKTLEGTTTGRSIWGDSG